MENRIPQLRFPEFSGEWEEKKLGEVAEVSSGGTPSRAIPHYWNGNVPWVSTTLIDFNFIDRTEEYITEEGLKKSSAKLFPVGTLLMAMYGQGKTRGKISILGIEASTNQACGAITTNKEILNPLFTFQNLANRYDEIRDLSNQGGQENLSGGIIKGIQINFPSLQEQTKIASFLTEVDKKLTALKQKKTLLEQYKKGVMQQIFSQQLRFKDDNGNDFPDWEEKKLGEVGSVLNGLTYSPNDISENGVLVLRSSNIKNGRLKFEDNVYVNKKDYTPVITGDVLICVRNGSSNLIGKNTLVTKEINGVAFGAFMSIYRSKSNNYLIHWFGSQNFFKNVYINLGATINSINGSDLKKFKVPFPCLKEQTKIANFLSAIDEKINHCQGQIEKMQVWKKGLLQQLFV